MIRPTILFFLISLLHIQLAFSQEVKLRQKSSKDLKEEFFALKSDKDVKHGIYNKYTVNVLDIKVPRELGTYQMGKKHGQWYYFNDDGTLKESGKYVDGKKKGVWEVYFSLNHIIDNDNPNEQIDTTELVHVGDFTIDKSIYQLASSGTYFEDMRKGIWKYYQRDGSVTYKYDFSQNKPTFPEEVEKTGYLNGNEEFINHIVNNLNYPPKAQLRNTTGVVFVVFKISKSGQLENIRYFHKLGNEFEKEISRVLTSVPENWIPTKSEKEFAMSISFKRSGQSLEKKIPKELNGIEFLTEDIVVTGLF